MANTLRRKMFKLGGEVNTHGVGITSGLEYRRPGYNAGGPVIKPGPDGQPRQHAILGGIMRATLGTAMPFVRSIARRLPGKLGGPREMGAGPGIRDYIKYGIDPKRTLGSGTIKELSQAQQARQLANLAFAPSGAALGTAGVAQALAERTGAINPMEDDDRLITSLLKGTGEFAANINPLNVASRAGQMLFGDPKKEDKNLYDLISGRGDKNTIEKQSIKSPVAEVAETQEEQFAKMKDDADKRAELYYDLMSDGGPNKTRALAAGLTNFGNLYDEDKVAAISGFSEGVGQELDRQSDIKSTAMQAAIGDVITGETQRKQMVEQAKLAIMSSPDLTAAQRSSSIKGLEAFEQGVVDLLPTNDKGDEINLTGLAPGTIYLDITGLTDGTYVAVSSQDTEDQVDSFNSISEARAHAAS